eukprot:jgi/Tetstr1/456534/TSEL_043256.t1
MDGVLLLCLRSGTCLYSKQYTDGFGLPAGVLHTSDQAGAMDAIALSGILYALFLQTNVSHSFDDHDATRAALKNRRDVQRTTGRADGLDIRMESMAVGDIVLHFATDRAAELMVVTSMKACISKTNASLLASRLLAEIMHQYSPVLQAVIRNTRGFKGMSSLLCRVYQEFPAMCARSALRKLSGAKPDWLYVAHVQSFFQAMKDEQHAKEEEHRHWWQFSRSSSAHLPEAVSPGPFQYVYQDDSVASGEYLAVDDSSLAEILKVVQRGTEILRAFCRDPAEQLRSMEVLMMRNFKEQCEGSNRGSMSSLADWAVEFVNNNGMTGAPFKGRNAKQRPSRIFMRIFILIEDDTLVAIPLHVTPGTPGFMGSVRCLLHEDIKEMVAFMAFLSAHVPERKATKTQPNTT